MIDLLPQVPARAAIDGDVLFWLSLQGRGQECSKNEPRCAETCAMIRTDLAAQGKLIGPNDLMIAAIARTRQATLVTHNVGEFGRVARLQLENWLEE
jgi:hypothetical protein